MNKNTIIGIIIVVILIGGGILYFTSNNNIGSTTGTTQSGSNTQDAETPDVNTTGVSGGVGVTVTIAKTVTVNYTGSGFNPATVEINKGDTVRFVNQSSGGMWVASSPHPTHTDYPSFDEKGTVQNGSSYEFTFLKVGSWKYHNHVNFPGGGFGTVVVK